MNARSIAGLCLLLLLTSGAWGAIPGLTGTTHDFRTSAGTIVTGEGNSLYMWGYGVQGGTFQYPGPTLVLTEGDVVTLNLSNDLPVPTSMVFPGMTDVGASGGVGGKLTSEAAPGGTVTYTFTAASPGTYLYHSGTRPDLQIEMGLVGAIIVRPAGAMGMHMAYAHADAHFDHEYLFLFTEADPRIHDMASLGLWDRIDMTDYWPVYWFLNGRNAPDTMSPAAAPWLPSQPYNCMPMMHPGDRILLRFISAGRDLHPFHTHGNHFRAIAYDGKLLESAPGAGADLSELHFTISVSPGGTADAIFEWTGAGLGWDIYGHSPEDPLEPNENPEDHGKPFPVILPDVKDIAIGAAYSGSPYLGTAGALPPNEGGFNPHAGYYYMWHSHNEKEMVNNDVFPGGNMTMLMILPHTVPIMH